MPGKYHTSSLALATAAIALVCFTAMDAVAGTQNKVTLATNATGEQIQAALDSFAATGGEVILSRGTFTVRHPIALQHDNLTLRGSGPETVLYLADNANCPVVVLGIPDRPGKSPINNLRLSNLFIDGNRKHQTVELWRKLSDGSIINNNGVEVRNVNDTVVEDVTCARCRSGGLVTAANNRRLAVRRFASFDNEFDGLACYLTEDSEFSHLDLHDNQCAGISLDLNFNRNTLRDCALTNNDVGIFMRQSCGNTFANLTITKSRGHGVFMAQTGTGTPTGWKYSPGSECIGNTFTNLSVSNSGGKAFVVNDAGCTNNVLHECRFESNPKGGLFQARAQLVLATALIER